MYFYLWMNDICVKLKQNYRHFIDSALFIFCFSLQCEDCLKWRVCYSSLHRDVNWITSHSPMVPASRTLIGMRAESLSVSMSMTSLPAHHPLNFLTTLLFLTHFVSIAEVSMIWHLLPKLTHCVNMQGSGQSC